jgi:hypothetical protein
MLRVVFCCCPPLRRSPSAALLAENLLRQLLGGPRPAPISHALPLEGSANQGGWGRREAPELPVFAASIADSTITRMRDETHGTEATSADASACCEDAGDTTSGGPVRSAACAVIAMEGASQEDMLALSASAAALQRPLLTAFVLQQLRCATLATQKGEWQRIVAQVNGDEESFRAWSLHILVHSSCLLVHLFSWVP